jgi:DNA-binding Xre family transcriptional regulator
MKKAGPRLVCRLDALLIEREREGKKISGRKLAELAGVTELTVGRARRNELTQFDARTMGRICQVLEITPGELFGLEADPEPQ